MKRTALGILATAILAAALAPGSALAQSDGDWAAIRKAVQDTPAPQSGQTVKWFKVLVTDNETKKDKVRITLPIALVELFVRCADDRHVRLRDHDLDLDFGELLAELKKMGPLTIIEVFDDDDHETVKVWLE